MKQRQTTKPKLRKKVTAKKKVNKNTRVTSNRLFLLVLWLFILGITLTTSSYAWFTSNRVATVWLMDVTVAAQNGVEISADAIDWSPELAYEDLLNADATYRNSVNQLPSILEPVSTAGYVNNGFMNMYFGKVENARNSSTAFTLASTRLEETRGSGETFDGKFLAFDIFLKTQAATNLYLTTESGATYSGEESAGIENSMRFAFVVEGNTSEEASAGTAQSLRTNSNNDVYIWEPNYDIHTDFAIENARDVYGLNIASPSGVVPYEGIKSEFTRENGVMINTASTRNFPDYFDTVNVDYTSRVNFNNNIQVFSLLAGVTKIRVYMWIEGQDVDCENNAAVGGISLNLQFSTNPS